MMETNNRHRQRFPRTIACGYDGCEVLRSPSRLISLCTRGPPFNLSWVSLDTEPASSKELDVSAAESQIACNGALLEINLQRPFFAVLAESLKSLAVGAPLLPTLRIFSPDPAAMRFFLALMLA
jgi:hypothetical protein